MKPEIQINGKISDETRANMKMLAEFAGCYRIDHSDNGHSESYRLFKEGRSISVQALDGGILRVIG